MLPENKWFDNNNNNGVRDIGKVCANNEDRYWNAWSPAVVLVVSSETSIRRMYKAKSGLAYSEHRINFRGEVS